MANERYTTQGLSGKDISSTIESIAGGHRHILIEAACGAGKTIMALLILKELYEIYGYKASWCAMRRHLLIQAKEENDSKVGFSHIQYTSMFDKHPPKAHVLVQDEGHHSAADSAVSIYAKTNPIINIGLTATPYRSDRMKLCFSKVIRDAGIRSLIDQGYLAPYHHYTFDLPWTPENVANIYLNDINRWGKTVIYFLTRAECERCAAIVRTQVPCEVVWANSDQEAQIRAFMGNEIPALLNMLILTEGFNAPDLKTVMVRPGSRGPTIQMVGRSLRPKPFAQVVQNNETKWSFTRTASADKKFVLDNGVWEDRDIENEVIAIASTNTIRAISTIDVALPPLFKKRDKKRDTNAL